MTKPRKARGPDEQRAARVAAEVVPPPPGAPVRDPEQPQGENRAGGQSTPPQPLPEWAVTLSGFRVRPMQARPALPPELADQLAPQETALVWRLVSGLSWQQSLSDVGVSADDQRRTLPPSEAIRNAAEWLAEAIAEQCGVSRRWVISRWVALHERATSPADFDGATAAKSLTALGEVAGVGRKRREPGDGVPVDQVADLMLAVAARGKPALDPARALPRLVGASSVAAQQGQKTQADQVAVRDESSVISEQSRVSP